MSNKQVSEVSKTFYRYCKAKKIRCKKVTQKQFLTGLVGSKVKLVSESGTYDGRDYTVLQNKSLYKHIIRKYISDVLPHKYISDIYYNI